MKTRTIAHVLSAAAATVALPLAAPAWATDQMVLCSPPLTPDCVDPKWGQVDPDTLVGGGGSGGSASTMSVRPIASGSPIEVRMSRAAAGRGPGRTTTGADATGPAANARLKAVVDVTQRFSRETAALTAAIRRAVFDDQGNLVRGDAEIAAAAAVARKAAPEYALTLYVKAPTSLDGARRDLLQRKLAAINAVLGRAGGDPAPKQ